MARNRLHRPWTREDDEALIVLLKGRMTFLAIAAKLRRRIAAIKKRANYLGVSADVKRRDESQVLTIRVSREV
jgi:hypothetical protein